MNAFESGTSAVLPATVTPILALVADAEIEPAVVGHVAVVVVHDQGRGYDVSRPVKGLKSGRGLAIIRSMVSSVDVGEDGRLIRLRFPR